MLINAENRPKMPMGKRVRRGVTRVMLMAVLAGGIAGCGEAGASGTPPGSTESTPYPQATPTTQIVPTATFAPTVTVQPTEVPTAAPTGTPPVQDIYFTPGKWECHDVPAYSVAQGDFYWKGRREFDNDAKSGAVGKILEAGTACTSNGGDIIVASPSTIDSITGQAVDEMSQTGCENNKGCPDGITVWVAGNN